MNGNNGSNALCIILWIYVSKLILININGLFLLLFNIFIMKLLRVVYVFYVDYKEKKKEKKNNSQFFIEENTQSTTCIMFHVLLCLQRVLAVVVVNVFVAVFHLYFLLMHDKSIKVWTNENVAVATNASRKRKKKYYTLFKTIHKKFTLRENKKNK